MRGGGYDVGYIAAPRLGFPNTPAPCQITGRAQKTMISSRAGSLAELIM